MLLRTNHHAMQLRPIPNQSGFATQKNQLAETSPDTTGVSSAVPEVARLVVDTIAEKRCGG